MAQFFIDRPIFAWVIALFILVGGGVAITQLPIAQYPPVAPPSIVINAVYPGASAQTLEDSVISVIEQEMNGSPGLIYMESVTQANGSGQITLSFQPGTNIKAWLFTILRNEFYSQMRKRGREVQDSEGIMTGRLAVHPAQHGQLDLKDFRGALEQLPEDQREAIILIGASGFSYEEAAEICGCAVGTIKSRVSRARTKLQDILKISGEDEYGPDAISAQVMGSSAA